MLNKEWYIRENNLYLHNQILEMINYSVPFNNNDILLGIVRHYKINILTYVFPC